MRIALFILSLCLISEMVYGLCTPDKEKYFFCPKKKHAIKLSVSDGLTLSITNFLGIGDFDPMLDTGSYDQTTSGVIGIGYRYSINRFKVGGDFGFANVTTKKSNYADYYYSIKDRKQNFLILPIVEYLYYKTDCLVSKKGILELYGSVSSGMDFTRSIESRFAESNKIVFIKSDLIARFAYQINPIAILIGNDTIGGFLELGIGYRGFLTAGISLNF